MKQYHIPLFGKIIFIFLSLIWICFSGHYLMISGWWADRANLSPMELVGGLGGLALPIFVFFLAYSYYAKNETIEQHTKKIQNYLNQLIDPNDENAQYTQDLTRALQQQIREFKSVFTGVNNHTDAVRDDLQRWIAGLNKLVKTVDTQTVSAIQKMATHIQKVAEITHQSNQQATQSTTLLAGQADMLEDVSQKTQKVMTGFIKDLNQEIQEIQNILHAFETARTQIGQTTTASAQVVDTLEKNTQHMSQLLMHDLQPKKLLQQAEQAEQTFQKVATNLDHRVNQFQNVLKNINGDIQVVARGLQDHTNTLEKHLNFKHQQSLDFLRQASEITTQLQHYSVELAHLFTPKNEEELWSHYYAGDKTIFMRHLRQAIQQSKADKVRQLFHQNMAFQSAVEHYMQTFEQMTVQANENAADSPLLGILIGSDVGRLYMVLAQILGRRP